MMKEEEISIVALLDSVHEMLISIEASAIKQTGNLFIKKIRWASWEVASVSESRSYVNGVCFQNIQGGFRVYNWHDHGMGCDYLMFDDLKARNIWDKVLVLFGHKVIKPLNFGIHYGRFHVAGRYVQREEFIDFVMDRYPELFEWILFNLEMF